MFFGGFETEAQMTVVSNKQFLWHQYTQPETGVALVKTGWYYLKLVAFIILFFAAAIRSYDFLKSKD